MEVTLEVVRTLLQNQADAYKATFSILIHDVKEELKSVRNDISDLKASIQFTQCKFDEAEKKMDDIDRKVSMHQDNLNTVNNYMDSTEFELEYLENQSRRNNIRITGIAEDKDVESSWDDTEKIVKVVIKDKSKLSEDFEIERCHRVSRKKTWQSQPGKPDGPRPIVAKMARWKDKELILKKAREIKPDGTRFLADLSRRTMQKREEQVPELLAARRMGKTAYFVLDKLIIRDAKKPPDISQHEGNAGNDSEQEISFRS